MFQLIIPDSLWTCSQKKTVLDLVKSLRGPRSQRKLILIEWSQATACPLTAEDYAYALGPNAEVPANAPP